MFEADCNQNNKKLGRDMMYMAEDLEAIAKEQYESRKHMSAITHGVNKHLTFNLGVTIASFTL